MRTKQTVGIVSTTALAAGMAQGAIYYTNQNVVLPTPVNPNTPAPFDISGDTIYDFFLSFDGFSSANSQKPYVSGYLAGSPPNSAVLGTTSTNVSTVGSYPYQNGAPVAGFGTMINANYLTPVVTNYGKVYLYQDGNGNYVGGWGLGAKTEGYLGVELFDAGNSITNFGWLHLIWDPTANPRTITCVDSGYETTPGLGIIDRKSVV